TSGAMLVVVIPALWMDAGWWMPRFRLEAFVNRTNLEGVPEDDEEPPVYLPSAGASCSTLMAVASAGGAAGVSLAVSGTVWPAWRDGFSAVDDIVFSGSVAATPEDFVEIP